MRHTLASPTALISAASPSLADAGSAAELAILGLGGSPAARGRGTIRPPESIVGPVGCGARVSGTGVAGPIAMPVHAPRKGSPARERPATGTCCASALLVGRRPGPHVLSGFRSG